VGIVILYSVGFWVISARKWFVGPVKQIEGMYIALFGTVAGLTAYYCYYYFVHQSGGYGC